jgi:hypothetical protein
MSESAGRGSGAVAAPGSARPVAAPRWFVAAAVLAAIIL